MKANFKRQNDCKPDKMLKILISTEEGTKDCERLKHTDASVFHAFHIRKQNWGINQMREYIEKLPVEWQRKSVLHSHFELIHSYSLKGIHLNERNRISGLYSQYAPFVISTSFHNTKDLLGESNAYEYVFLSPIFDSITKRGYNAAFSEQELIVLNSVSKHKIIALGGVTDKSLSNCRDLGFCGVAYLGSFWH